MVNLLVVGARIDLGAVADSVDGGEVIAMFLGCYCDRLTRTIVHVFVDGRERCTCKARKLKR